MIKQILSKQTVNRMIKQILSKQNEKTDPE